MVGMAGQPMSSSVTITPEKKYDFKIIKAFAEKGTHIKVTLSPRPEGAPGYIVSVENLKKTMVKIDIFTKKVIISMLMNIKVQIS